MVDFGPIRKRVAEIKEEQAEKYKDEEDPYPPADSGKPPAHEQTEATERPDNTPGA